VVTKSRRARIISEIVFGLIAQLVVALIFGGMAVFAVSENNAFGFNVIAVVIGVGLSIGLWKHVDDVIRFVKNGPNYY